MRAVWLPILLTPALAHADRDWPEANPGRPSVSDNSDATAPGAFEIEAGIASETGDAAVAQYTFKYGIDEHLDVRFNLEHGLWGGEKSITAASALVKVVPKLSDDRVLGVAFEGYVSLPVGGAKVGGGGLAIATYKRDVVQVDACAIVDESRAEMTKAAVTVTPVVAVGVKVLDPVEVFVEPGVDLAVRGGGANNRFVGAGLGYTPHRSLVLDAAIYREQQPRTLFLAGLTFSMYVPPRYHRH